MKSAVTQSDRYLADTTAITHNAEMPTRTISDMTP